jgi:four helix bundle protein
VVVSGGRRKDLRWAAADGRHVLRGCPENALVQDFRRLLVWQRAHELVLNVRRAIRGFSRRERGSLKAQMANAAESIAFNIVEGCGSTSSKEFARFLDISIKSTCELEYQLQLATDSGLLSRRVWIALSAETVEIRRMLCGLRRKVLHAPSLQQDRTDNH